jgi:hypothetical protein
MRALAWIAIAAVASTASCGGGRSDVWSQPIGTPQAIGLAQSVALIDGGARRVVALSATAGGALTVRRTPTGRNVVAAIAAPDGHKLYLLSAGHRATLGDAVPDERPRLTAYDDGPAPPMEIDLGLTDPLDGLMLDPTGRWAVVFAAASTSHALVTNPNELVIVDLAARTARHHTVHSFGGRPDNLMITPMLSLPEGPRQLLIVQSQQALALLPLGDDDNEISVRLDDSSDTTQRPPPAAVVVDDGDPASADDARIGIRFQNDRNVMILQLAGSSGGAAGFLPSVNVVDVGGVPSDIAFVRTDGGLRLAALVPTASVAVLVDPTTTIVTSVALPAPYQRLSLVTGGAGGTTGTADVALLWQGGTAGAGVAFWELGQAAGQAFRSIETVAVGAQVGAVLDVPLAGAALKVLGGTGSGAQTFYVLDLAARTAAPLSISEPRTTLKVSPTGQRVWTFVPGGMALASTDVASKQVRSLRADSAVDDVFEIGHSSDDGTRSLIALHDGGAIGVTVYDVDAPDDSTRRIYGGLLEEGVNADE